MNISEIVVKNIDVMIGTVAYFACSSPPIGWLECNGAVLNRSDYIELFSEIGTTYGYTNSDNFILPDLRGEFIRCWDNGRGVDKYPTYTYGGSTTESNRQFDSNVQSYATKTISGSVAYVSETWAYNGSAYGVFRKPQYGGYGQGLTPSSTDDSAGGAVYFDSSRVINSSLGETRPRNVVLIACIKY
jgi:microcystin-dependent protein